MKQLKKAWAKKKYTQAKSNNHTTLLRTLPVWAGKEVYETFTSNKIILAAQENSKIHNFRHIKRKKEHLEPLFLESLNQLLLALMQQMCS